VLYTTALNTLTLAYAALPRAFEFRNAPPAPARGEAPRQAAWIFKLKSGGKVLALSFEELADFYQVQVEGGSVTIPRQDVEQVLPSAPPRK